ncbi:hypothetical protein MPSEU_000297000 [Mayamaea pseudoterrestris]|nr:hypothetical protein MPSEU_000297000 [Mayamaea pseudoterrestris]
MIICITLEKRQHVTLCVGHSIKLHLYQVPSQLTTLHTFAMPTDIPLSISIQLTADRPSRPSFLLQGFVKSFTSRTRPLHDDDDCSESLHKTPPTPRGTHSFLKRFCWSCDHCRNHKRKRPQHYPKTLSISTIPTEIVVRHANNNNERRDAVPLLGADHFVETGSTYDASPAVPATMNVPELVAVELCQGQDCRNNETHPDGANNMKGNVSHSKRSHEWI